MNKNINLKHLIYFQIIYNCFIKFFISDFHFPSILNYVTDIVNILIFLGIMINLKRKKSKKIKIGSSVIIIALIILNIISIILNLYSPLLFFWGFRNVYRFFMFFISCIYLLNKDDYIKILEILEKILIINFFICIYEFVIREIKFDNLGGIFGNNVVGGNGPLNVLMIIVTTYVLISFINGKKKLKEVGIIILLNLLVASLAELKMYYFELIILVLLISLFVKKNIKFFIAILLGTILVSYALSIYTKLYPNNAGFLSMDFFMDYTANSTYGSTTDINRLTALTMINDRFFNSAKEFLFGIGLGNADTSQFDIFNSRFYEIYGQTFKYNWFMHAFVLIEMGWSGLILYFAFLISIVIISIKYKKVYVKEEENVLLNVSLIVSIFSCILMVYNQSLRIETMGYAIFLFLAIPYSIKRENIYEGEKE